MPDRDVGYSIAMLIYAFHHVARCRRKGCCCEILEYPPRYVPGPHYGQRPYYVVFEDGKQWGAFWSEHDAVTAARALLRQRDRRRLYRLH